MKNRIGYGIAALVLAGSAYLAGCYSNSWKKDLPQQQEHCVEKEYLENGQPERYKICPLFCGESDETTDCFEAEFVVAAVEREDGNFFKVFYYEGNEIFMRISDSYSNIFFSALDSVVEKDGKIEEFSLGNGPDQRHFYREGACWSEHFDAHCGSADDLGEKASKKFEKYQYLIKGVCDHKKSKYNFDDL